MNERPDSESGMTARRTIPTLIEASKREAQPLVAGLLADVMTSSDPADRFFGAVFVNNVDLEAAFFDVDPRSGERVLSAPMVKDCQPSVWLGLRLRISLDGSNASLVVEKNKVRAAHGHALHHAEIGVHYKEGAGTNRHPEVRGRESVHVTDDWYEAALSVKKQIVKATRSMLAADAVPAKEISQRPIGV